jgi:hypothetical protein
VWEDNPGGKKMKNRFSILLIFILIPRCSFSSVQKFATSTPHPSSPLSSPTNTLLPIPTITFSPEPSLTPTFPPYTDKPFSLVFTRNGNLWIANIGERVTERQLTFEPQEMRIVSFDVSPEETRVAYIPYQLEPLNSLVKLADIATGDTRVVLGENDPFSETRVVWLDNATIAYKNQDHLVPTFTTERVDNVITYIIYDLSTERRIATTDFNSLSPSPDKSLWLGCSGNPYVMGCSRYTLQDLVNSKQYKFEGEIELGGFIGWSSDSQSMLFNTVTSPDICMSQLIMVDVKTLEQKAITSEDENVWNASFSPTGNLLFYEQAEIADLGLCKSGKADYWILDLDNQQTYEIPADFQKDVWDFDWTPDGKRLLFFHDSYSGYENELWSMNLDGSDLKPLLSNVEDFEVLQSIP